MIQSSPEHQTLDPQTIDTLETSLVMQIIKLFTIVAKADRAVTRSERRFVSEYCHQQYPPTIAKYLYGRFEDFLKTKLLSEDVTRAMNAQMSYQEKIFCMIKVFEMIISEKPDERDFQLSHDISNMLKIHPADRSFIEEYLFGFDRQPDFQEGASAIIRILVSNDLSSADVYLPFPGLDMEVCKIYDLYCLRQKSTDSNQVLIESLPVRQNYFGRIPRNADIQINDYTMKFQDLKIFFENKVHSLETDLFLNPQDEGFAWDRQRIEASTMHLGLRGSKVQLSPLRDDLICSVNGADVCTYGMVYVNLDDKIYVNNFLFNIREVFFHLNREKLISLDREKDYYEMTNDARGDFFIADDHADKWTTKITKRDNRFFLVPGDCPYQIRVDGKPVTGEKELTSRDSLFINNRHLIFDFENAQVKQTLFSFEKLVAKAIKFAFDDGSLGINDVSFDIAYGDLVCIMGPSGCGKSTLLNIVSGLSRPVDGNIRLGEHDLHQDYETVKDFIGFVPQDDLLLANLTVYENLYYYAKLRFPDRRKYELDTQIDHVLHDIGLFDKKNSRVGSSLDKYLSGGQRKRLNIGLELLANTEVYLLDEPTSGLSSKDSEKILELLDNIAARGKIVLVVIHQPSSRLYNMFNKVILLDTGGHLAFFGTTQGALNYFQRHRETAATDHIGDLVCPCCKSVQPDLLLDTLEESLRDVDGTSLRERKFSPQYWKEQYFEYRKGREVIEASLPQISELPPPQIITFADRLNQFYTLLARNFRSKFRDRSNLIITFLGSPLLGWGVGWVTKFAPNDTYSLYANDLYKTFLFTTVIVAMFFGMTNSIDEVIGDRAIFLRERMLSLQHRAYLSAKFIVLAFFGVIQCALFLALGFWVLEVKELFVYHWAFLCLVSFSGIAVGLFISAIPEMSSKAAQNFIPLVLIPQIILGGALIVYEEMNKELRFYKETPIPEICQIMPSRWGYEGMVVLQATFNRFDWKYDELGREMNDLKRKRPELVNGKEEIVRQNGEGYFLQERKKLQGNIDALDKERDVFMAKVGLEYGNSDIHAKVAMSDAAFSKNATSVYKMLVSRKTVPFLKIETSTPIYNAAVIVVTIVITLAMTLFLLRYREQILLGYLALKKLWRRTGI